MDNKILVAGHNGFIVKRRPKKYKMTKPQRVFSEIVKKCGIRKGITKASLQIAMKECVGPAMRRHYKND